MKRRLVYIAAPLFTPLEREQNVRIAGILAGRFDTFLPQRDGILIPGQSLDAGRFSELADRVFESDTIAVKTCDLLLAVLDGRTVDEGVAFELGLAYAFGKPCLGFRTDSRSLLPWGNNPMIEKALARCFSSEQELSEWVTLSGQPGHANATNDRHR